jgi:hypothetical protein
MPATKTAAAVEGEVLSTVEMQQQLASLENQLMQLPDFQQFIALTKSVNARLAEVRANVEAVMVPAYQRGEVDKSIKGDWGSVTVTESDKFEIDEAQLAPKFFKKVVDESKIRATYQLEGKAPKGTKPYKKYGIMIKYK